MPVGSPSEPTDQEALRQLAVERSGALRRRGDQELQQITELAAASYDAAFSSIALISGNREILISRCRIPFWERPREDSFCAIAIHAPGEPLCVADARAHARLAKLSYVKGPPFVRFYAGACIMDRGGYALGALCVADPEAREGGCDMTRLASLARDVERALLR